MNPAALIGAFTAFAAGFAVPAQAQTDALFLQDLDRAGISYVDPQAVIAGAHRVLCRG